MSTVANLFVTVYAEMEIGQVSLLKLTMPAERPGLGTKYQG